MLDVFPQARIINIVRDPRDVLLSQKNKWRRRFLGASNIPVKEALRAWANYHPYTISKLWVAAVRTARRFDSHPRFYSVRFEDLVQSPKTTIQALCTFTGIVFESAMLEVPQVGSSAGIDTPNLKGINAGRSGSWRKGGLEAVELSICEKVSGEEMLRLGYELDPISVPVWRTTVSMAVFGFKAALALLLNLNRTRNLRETLKRRLARNPATL